MKKILDRLRGARWIELLLAIAAAAILLLQLMDGSGGSDLERRLVSILSSVEGVGGVEVMVVEGEDGAVEGVLVVADGADDAGTCLRIQYAVQTLLGVEAASVEVVRRAG